MVGVEAVEGGKGTEDGEGGEGDKVGEGDGDGEGGSDRVCEKKESEHILKCGENVVIVVALCSGDWCIKCCRC